MLYYLVFTVIAIRYYALQVLLKFGQGETAKQCSTLVVVVGMIQIFKVFIKQTFSYSNLLNKVKRRILIGEGNTFEKIFEIDTKKNYSGDALNFKGSFKNR
jgi:hypothetical protein